MRKKRSRLWIRLIAIILLIEGLSLIFPYISQAVIHLRYQASFVLPCHVRYEPLVFVFGETQGSRFNVEIRWETSCASLQYDLIIKEKDSEVPERIPSNILDKYDDHSIQVANLNNLQENKTYYFKLVEKVTMSVFGKWFYFTIPLQNSSNLKIGLISDNQMGFVTFRYPQFQ